MASPAPYPKHARLGRSIIASKTLTKAARVILEALYYHLRIGKPMVVSNAKIASWAGVSEGTVSLLMPVLAAEPGNRYGHQIPFLTREWDEAARRYVTTLLPQPEVRGWTIAPPPPPDPPQPPAAPEPEVVVLADQLSFFDLLPGSMTDRHTTIPVAPMPAPQTAINQGSTTHAPILIHDHVSVIDLATAAPSEQQAVRTRTRSAQTNTSGDDLIRYLTEKRIYSAVAARVRAAQPTLTVADFQRLEAAVRSRAGVRNPTLYVATILARGEQLDSPETPVASSYTPPKPPSKRELIFRPDISNRTRSEYMMRWKNREGDPEALRALMDELHREYGEWKEPASCNPAA